MSMTKCGRPWPDELAQQYSKAAVGLARMWQELDERFEIIPPLSPVILKPVVVEPRQVTVLHGGVLFALMETEDGGLLACEWLAEGLTAPGTWNLDKGGS